MNRHLSLSRVAVLAALSTTLGLAGCGGGPRPVEVTEPWTSGDERAVGIEARDDTSEARDGVTVSDATSPPQ